MFAAEGAKVPVSSWIRGCMRTDCTFGQPKDSSNTCSDDMHLSLPEAGSEERRPP